MQLKQYYDSIHVFNIIILNEKVTVEQFPKTSKEIKNTKREFFFMSMKKTNISIPFMLDVC